MVLEKAGISRDYYTFVIFSGPERSRNKIGKALTDTGAGFDRKPGAAVKRRLHPSSHFGLLRTVFIIRKKTREWTVGQEKGFGGGRSQRLLPGDEPLVSEPVTS